MTAKTTIVDYGSGNLFGLSRAIEVCGGSVHLTSDADAIANADRLLLPGVGAFGAAAKGLKSRGLIAPIRQFVQTGRPFLGICVGMQLMMGHSSEFGHHEGLELIPGKVEAIPDTADDGTPHPVPHTGWSSLRPGGSDWKNSPLDGTEDESEVYFVHSFAVVPDDPSDTLAITDYNGRSIVAAVSRENLTGFQFHPERSGPRGLAILSRFSGAANSEYNQTTSNISNRIEV